MGNRPILRLTACLLIVAAGALAQEQKFLRRSTGSVEAVPDDLTNRAAGVTYKPLFGVGDRETAGIVTLARYGELTVASGASSAVVGYPAEEQLYYILEGAGTLIYGEERVEVKADDFLYLPVGLQHGIANTSHAPLRVMVMGYRIPEGVEAPTAGKLQIANAAGVDLQILGSHGPTTQFKLLMGTTTSTRDKLPAARVMTSLFIMDFAPGGTNIPHNHPREEEIYYILRGSGDMVAGVDAGGSDVRRAAKQGDAFFIFPGTRVGFYSSAKQGQPHDLVLAVRSALPGRGGRRGAAGQE